jgi:hypothetical protein
VTDAAVEDLDLDVARPRLAARDRVWNERRLRGGCGPGGYGSGHRGFLLIVGVGGILQESAKVIGTLGLASLIGVSPAPP